MRTLLVRSVQECWMLLRPRRAHTVEAGGRAEAAGLPQDWVNNGASTAIEPLRQRSPRVGNGCRGGGCYRRSAHSYISQEQG